MALNRMRYSTQELQRHVRLERRELLEELSGLTKRIRWIEGRLEELEKADNLLA